MNANFCIVDFNAVDHGAQLSAAERHFVRQYILAHDCDERRDGGLGESRIGLHFRDGAVGSYPRDIAFGFYRRDQVFEGRVGSVASAMSFSMAS